MSRTERETHSCVVSSRQDRAAVGPQRRAAARRLEADEAAAARGDADRAAAVVRVRDRAPCRSRPRPRTPPLEPPVVRSVSHGLRVGPYASGSVVGTSPSSGVFVRPTQTKPASRKRRARLSVWFARQPASFRNCMPSWCGSPATRAREVLEQERARRGTDRRAVCPAPRRAPARSSGWMTALSSGFSFSMRLIAASTSSSGDASPARTSSACAVASRNASAIGSSCYGVQRRAASRPGLPVRAAPRPGTARPRGTGAPTSCTPIGRPDAVDVQRHRHRGLAGHVERRGEDRERQQAGAAGRRAGSGRRARAAARRASA